MHEDNLFFFQIYWEAKKVFWTAERLYYFRKRPGSITATRHSKKSFDGYAVNFLEMWKQCKEHPGVIEQYPDILNYVKFSFAQAMKCYKNMTFYERKQSSELVRKVKKDMEEAPINKSISAYLFLYVPFLLK